MLTVLLANVLPVDVPCKGYLKYKGYEPSAIDTAIYLAHVSALAAMCLTDEHHGLALENDVEPVGDWPMSLAQLSHIGKTALTILAPSSPKRRYGPDFLRGKYTYVRRGSVWGSGAYLYNLRIACSWMKVLGENVGCVPWDLAAPRILTHSTVTVPWYINTPGNNQSHNDAIHLALPETNAWVKQMWELHGRYTTSH